MEGWNIGSLGWLNERMITNAIAPTAMTAAARTKMVLVRFIRFEKAAPFRALLVVISARLYVIAKMSLLK